ncbi:MAG: DUF4175 family protein [Elusimicrobia bacterium]|nr:DUF4175 family protein [Elusimicrobiota bacterium]
MGHFDGRLHGVLRSLTETVDYRVAYQNHRSARFRLTPFDPSKLLHLRAVVEPPEYAQRKPDVFEDVLSLRVLAGSRVRWSLEIDPADSLLRLGGEGPALVMEKKGGEWNWMEAVDTNKERPLWARRSNGSGEVLLARLVMEAVLDAPPQVTLLGPSEDLQADVKDQIPVVAELRDDVGLSDAGVSFRVNGGTWVRQGWKRFSAGVVDDVMEKEFDLDGRRLNTGDRVEFFVYARDGRRSAGEGQSEVRRIDVVDMSAAHEKVIEETEAFQKALADRLAEQRELRETVAVSTPNWAGLLTGQRQVARRLTVDEERLKGLLDQMVLDPLTLPETILTYQGLAEHLEELGAFTMPEADRSLSNQDQPGAERTMDQAIAELEKMSQLLAQSARAQNARQLLRDQGELSNMAENMARSLGGKSTLTPEEARQMQETARAMQEAMDRIRERVEKMQKQWDKEYLKNAQVEMLRFDRVSRAFARLSEALEGNDAAGALAAAKEALEQLKEIERQLSRADQSASGEGHGSAEEEAMTEEQAQLQKLIQRQESLLDRTLDVQERRVARRLAGQTKALEEVQRLLGRWSDPSFLVNGSTAVPEGGDLTEGERGLLSGEAEEQGTLAVETFSLATVVAETAQRTAFLSPKISRRLSSASVEMEGASQALRTFLILPAQGKQEKALELLRDAHENLSNALKNMQSLSQGSGAGGKHLRRVGGSGGARGTTGDVNLPRADDFRPPMEFRQEILDSMKESYPKDQEAPVQDYYRHWTK